MPIRDLFVRDLSTRIEGVVKVYDHAALAQEIRDFVLTDSLEKELKTILDAFTESLDARRKQAQLLDDMGVWISGFFGSGKSHFAKLIGALLQNERLDPATGETAIDLFERHLTGSRYAKDIKRRLAEIRRGACVRTIAFEIKSKQTLNNPGSIAEIILSTFYEGLGFSDAIYLARIEKRLAERGRYEDFKNEYARLFGESWEEGRKQHEFNRGRIAKVMARIYKEEYTTEAAALEGLKDAYRAVRVTAEGVARELVAWVDAQPAPDGRLPHLVFVIDEMGAFIGSDASKIEELRALVEQIGNQGKGKVWLLVTSQQALEQVCDRANLQLPLLGKLDARFGVKVGLVSDEINKVIGERLLRKREARLPDVDRVYNDRPGYFSQLADIKSTRTLGRLDLAAFREDYPFLPHTIRLAQDIFEALSGFRISGGVRSMITVTQEVLTRLAGEEVGVLASFDQVFDAVEKDLYSQEYLGVSGVQAIRESGERLPGTPLPPPRLLKVLWLLQRVQFVPRTPEVLAKLLVGNAGEDFAALRPAVEQTLAALQTAGYVARDEASGEYKYLNEKERTIEQEIQRQVSGMGLGPAVRQAKEVLKAKVLTKARLDQFQIKYGKSQALFPYNVVLDGEELTTGEEVTVSFTGPLSVKKKDRAEVERENKARGAKGRTIYWLAATPEHLEGRLKRYEALKKVTEDERFTRDTADATRDALSEKRKELKDLGEALARDLDLALRRGHVYYSGDDADLQGDGDLKAVLQDVGKTVLGNLYTSFAHADKAYNFKNLARVLNPAEKKLHAVEPELDLFDTQGMLQRERPLPATVLEVVKDFEDENKPTDGAALLTFVEHIPFGWPSEVVRLVLAACFRGGALYLEVPTAQGFREVYDYTEAGTADLFAKVNTFKAVRFRTAQTGLSVEELKEAARLLIRLGVADVTEAGTVIAARVREVGARLCEAAERGRTYAGFGLPLPELYKTADGVCKKAVTTRDPTAAVKEFLARGEEWVALHRFAQSLDDFLAEGRDKLYAVSRRILDLCRQQPVAPERPEAEEIRKGLEDAEAVVAGKAILDRWPAYRDAYHRALAAYRTAYQQVYGTVRQAVEGLRSELVEGEAYRTAPADGRDAVLARYFGPGGALHLPAADVTTAEELLAAAVRHSLNALQGIPLALPGWRSAIEADLLALPRPVPPTGPGPPPVKTYEWRPQADLAGRRFQPGEETALDRQLDEIKARLRRKLAEGFTIVVK